MLKKYLAGFVFVALFLIVSITTFAAGDTPSTAVTPGYWETFTTWAFSTVGSGAKYIASSAFTGAMYLIGQLLYGLLYAIDGFVAFFAYWAGIFMDNVLYYTVVDFTPTFIEMTTSVDSVNGKGLIYYAWSMVRDLLNAGVFFVVVYHAIRAMFNGFEDIKQKFVALLVFVVLVNFSLLFVKVVADISNVAILQMYNVAARPQGSSSGLFFKHVDGGETGLSSYVLNAVNPLSFFTAQRATPAVKAQLDQDSSTALYQLGLIFVHAYLVFLFLYISAILLTRAVTFIVLMIVSPILVAGWFYSGLEEESKKIRKELLEEALQGPGIIFFLLLSSMIVSGLLFGQSFTVASQKIQANSVLVANFVTFFKFAFFAAFNYYAFNFIRELTTRGSNWSEKLMGAGLALGFGGAAWGLRKTVGGLASRMYENDNYAGRWARVLKDEKATAAEKATAMRKLKTVDFLRNRTFDFRNNMTVLQKSALGAKVLTSLKTGMALPSNMSVGKASNVTSSSTKLKIDEKASERRENFKKMIAGAGQDEHSVWNSSLIDAGLVKITVNGKEENAKQYVDKYRAVEKQVGELQEKNKDIIEQRNAIKEIIAGRKPDDVVTIKGRTQTTRDWIGETNHLTEMQKENVDKLKNLQAEKDELNDVMVKINNALEDDIQKAGLVEEYKKQNKKSIEKSIDEMYANGEIDHLAEAHVRAGARMMAMATGEKPVTRISRANKNIHDRIQKAKSPSAKTKAMSDAMIRNVRSLVKLHKNSKTLKEIVNLNPELKRNFDSLQDFALNMNTPKYKSMGVDPSKPLPDNIRKEVQGLMNTVIPGISDLDLRSARSLTGNEESQFNSIANNHQSTNKDYIAADEESTKVPEKKK